MDITQAHKDELEKKIVETIMAALDNDTVSAEELPEVSSFVLDRIDTVVTQEELVSFLAELSGKWPIFASIATIEHGEVKEAKETQAIEDVLSMAKHGQINEAIDLAKSVTQASE